MEQKKTRSTVHSTLRLELVVTVKDVQGSTTNHSIGRIFGDFCLVLTDLLHLWYNFAL